MVESLEAQFAQSEEKRRQSEAKRTEILESYSETLRQEQALADLQKEVLYTVSEQRDRAKNYASELLKFKADAVLTDKELVDLEKQYLSLLNRELQK